MDTQISDSATLWSELQHLINTSPQGGWEEFKQAQEEFNANEFGAIISQTTDQNYPFDYTVETTPSFIYAYSDYSASPLTPTTTNSNFGASTPPNYQSSIDSDFNTMDPTSPTSDSRKKATYPCTFCTKVFEKKHLLKYLHFSH